MVSCALGVGEDSVPRPRFEQLAGHCL